MFNSYREGNRYIGLLGWFMSLLDRINFQKKFVDYFLPGQALFFVKQYLDKEDDKETITKIISWANELAKKWPGGSKPSHPGETERGERDYVQPVEFSRQRVLSFSTGDTGFTMIFTDITGINNASDLLNLLNYLKNNKYEDEKIELIPSPHWLASSSGTSRPGGTGGPGGWPVKAQPQNIDFWRFQLRAGQNNHTQLPSSDQAGEGVNIAILDTVPTALALQKAYEEWRWHHPLINNLYTCDRIHIYRANYEDLHETRDYRIAGHRYLMRDHGLFVAGIIHTLAPKATLHLYEVLNPYGAGSLETIFTKLEHILGESGIEPPLVINCSFTLISPPEGTMLYEIWRSIVDLIDGNLQSNDVIIVAAAGNDAKYNNPNPGSRPIAGYPAAFTKVVGVGAAPKGFPKLNDEKFLPASYSNLADTPPESGYLTLGGETGPENGVVGVYTGDFPKPAGCLWRIWNIFTLGRSRYGRCYPPPFLWDFIRVKYETNTTGWAWWAGTSFATAIFSGALAALYNSGRHSFKAQSIMADFLQTEKSVDDENVLPIEQR